MCYLARSGSMAAGEIWLYRRNETSITIKKEDEPFLKDPLPYQHPVGNAANRNKRD